jgi:acetyl esterase
VKNAAAYGGDITRLAVAGESAGANLVSALTLSACFERPEPFARRVFDTGVIPRATLPYCGLLEVSNPERFGQRRPMPVWVTSIINHCSDAYLHAIDEHAPGHHLDHLDLANPLTMLERVQRHGVTPERPLPPFFVAVGTRDPLLDDTRRLERVLNALNVTCDAHYYPGEIHAFHALVWRKQARRAWRDTFGFLARALRIRSTPRAVLDHAGSAPRGGHHAL